MLIGSEFDSASLNKKKNVLQCFYVTGVWSAEFYFSSIEWPTFWTFDEFKRQRKEIKTFEWCMY